MNVFAFILARGGSKGVPGKNIRDLAGKPLIGWTIEAALATPEITKVFVSTDDKDIAAVAERFGVDVLKRPAEMATDAALAHPVFEYHLAELAKRGEIPDVVVDLRPTSPLRRASRISEGINLLIEAGPEKADSVRAITSVRTHPYKMWKMDGNMIEPFLPKSFTGMDEPYDACRETLPEVYQNNGAMYAIWPNTILKKGSLTGEKVLGYVMLEDESVNIDTEADFLFAEMLMKEKIDQ